MVRAVKRDSNGQWRYIGGSDRGRFARKEDIDAYRLNQRLNSYGSNIPRDKSLQNSIDTIALRDGISRQEAIKKLTDHLRTRARVLATGSEDEQANLPGTP